MRNFGLGAMEFGGKKHTQKILVKYPCPCNMCALENVLS